MSELVCSLASSLNSGSVPKRHGFVWAETGANEEEDVVYVGVVASTAVAVTAASAEDESKSKASERANAATKTQVLNPWWCGVA